MNLLLLFGGVISALLIQNNEFLQELWPVTQLTIMNGNVSFQANPQICVEKIFEFMKHVNLTNAYFKKDVVKGINGYNAVC